MSQNGPSIGVVSVASAVSWPRGGFSMSRWFRLFIVLGLIALILLLLACGGSNSDVAGRYDSPFSSAYIELRSNGMWSLHDGEGTVTGTYKLSGTRITLLAVSGERGTVVGTLSNGVLNIEGVGRFTKR